MASTIVVLGDCQVGKSAFIQKVKTGEYVPDYKPSDGVLSNIFDLKTSSGPITLNLVEVSGTHQGIVMGYFLNMDAVILMFDLSNRISYKNIPSWFKTVERVKEGIPMVLVGNKSDVKERTVNAKQITFHRKKNIQYYEISVRKGYMIDKPLLYLLRKIRVDSYLTLTDEKLQTKYPTGEHSTDNEPAQSEETGEKVSSFKFTDLPPLSSTFSFDNSKISGGNTDNEAPGFSFSSHDLNFPVSPQQSHDMLHPSEIHQLDSLGSEVISLSKQMAEKEAQIMYLTIFLQSKFPNEFSLK